ncbi:acyltransferase family domain-containing protein [Ditylenchus destructor]|uniref:Acyltransferase family domain-containing protein n=1 Tax=Ditylenchus destructor TaxID=166010 RepID=A0AAD4NDA4_9BILA|nr:acyltransferase family domain-containing protein [Ditylenchus destructor]
MKRRNDIQGLRALAIVGVHLYHLSSEDFPSGLLGVDVFFVISGYLITSILHKKHRNSDTWIIIKDFYFRRIRRIVPLALIVILISLTVGLLVNSPRRPIQGERITGCLEMCKEAIFASTFTDNLVYLLFGSDFYDINRWPRFLLHYWSLAVEMQFYLISPILLFLSRKLRRKFVELTITMAIAIFSAYAYYKSDYFVSYCWLHCRLWEFLVGTLVYMLLRSLNSNETTLAYLTNRKNIVSQVSLTWHRVLRNKFGASFVSNILAVFLFILLLEPQRLFGINYHFPMTWRQLLAVSATSVILAVNSSLEEHGTLLICNENLVSLGDISYEFYLAHYMVICHMRCFNEFGDMGLTTKKSIVATLISFGLAKVLHNFVDPQFQQLPNWAALYIVILTLYFILTCLFALLMTFGCGLIISMWEIFCKDISIE